MMLVDVHAHMDFPDFEKDLDELILKNKKAGVVSIISNGVDKDSNRKVLALAKKYSLIKPALGIYPTHITKISEDAFQDELKFIGKQEIVGIGEVGLDYLKGDENPCDETDVSLMKARFQRMIDLSAKKKIPIICHSRRAELDVIDMLESSSAKKVVMHCFMGKKNLVKRVVDKGWYLSIPCIINKLQQLQDNVVLAPSSQLLTETDAPYLSPFPDIRRNEPMFVEGTVRKIAELKKLDPDEAVNIIFQNYQRLFL